MPRFVVSCNDEPVKTYALNEPVVTIGRLPENTIAIVNSGVSRRHAQIERDAQGNYVLSDLNSLNGTFVNDTRINKMVLADGDRILIGKYTVVFDLGDTTQVSAHSRGAPEPPAYNPPTEISVSLTEPPPTTTGQPAVSPPADKARSFAGLPVLIETNKHVVYKIDKPALTVGSSDEDDIFAEGLFIEGSHAAVEKRDDGIWLTCKKFLGTVKVNGKKVKTYRLQHKDRIEVGSCTLRYMENG